MNNFLACSVGKNTVSGFSILVSSLVVANTKVTEKELEHPM